MTTQKKLPDWWPKNPYPESIFPMKPSEYPFVIPDPHQRTALSGMLGRVFWEIASKSIFVAMCNYTDLLDEIEQQTSQET